MSTRAVAHDPSGLSGHLLSSAGEEGLCSFMSPHDKSYRRKLLSAASYGLIFLADHTREVQVKRLVTTVLSLCLMVPLSVQAEEAKHMLDANTLDNVRKVAPALEKYAQGPLADLWRRPGLAPATAASSRWRR